MRVVHVNTRLRGGGAARSVLSLHHALLDAGCDSNLYFLKGDVDSTSGSYQFRVSNAVIDRVRYSYRSRRRVDDALTDERSPFGADVVRQLPSSDVVHLHWVGGFVDWHSFFSRVDRPVIWTLRDMNPITGGCHVNLDCDGFMDTCGRCPKLNSDDERDRSFRILRRKHRCVSGLTSDDLHLVATSESMAARAQRSALFGRFPVERIPIGIDTTAFRPRDRHSMRRDLRIDPDAEIVLFVANSAGKYVKGFHLLSEALRGIDRKLFLLSVGGGLHAAESRHPHLHLGSVDSDLLLSMIFSHADVFVNPSLQEAFGRTNIEALSCGTPVVGFETGVIPELVETGAIEPARNRTVSDLRDALVRVLADKAAYRARAAAVRSRIETTYSLDAQARKYIHLYQHVMDRWAEAA